MKLVLASIERPIRSSGGPSRVTYEILKFLLNIPEKWNLYFLSLSDGFLKKITNPHHLEEIAKDRYDAGKDMTWVRQLLPGPLRTIAQEVWRFYRYYLFVPSKLASASAVLDQNSVLHVHGVLPGLSSVKTKGKIVWSEHSKGSLLREIHVNEGSPPTGILARSLKNAYKFMLERANLITFPSLSAKELFENYTGWRIPPERLKIVYNGVPDPIKIYNLHPEVEQGLIVTIAEHVPDKGLDLSIQALALHRAPWRWVVIGGYTRWTQELERLIAKYRLSDKVLLVGTLPHKEAMLWLSKAEVVLTTPRVCVFDLVILEAMALGKPIISTPVGGIREALGESYPLYASDPEGLASLLSTDKNFLKLVGQRNRERYERFFTLSRMMENYVMIYKELIQTEK